MVLNMKYGSNTEYGRSMIEMLGVLAIIGVLSVGGLAGYSKAIDMYRVNETVNQITHIVHNTRDLFRNQPNYHSGISFDESSMSDSTYTNRILADKAKIFPETLVKNNYIDLFGGRIYFFADSRFTRDDGKAFQVRFEHIPQEACIELATRDWNSSLGLIAMKIRGSTTSKNLKNFLWGKCESSYKQGEVVVCVKDMPLTLEQAVSACDTEKANWIAWKFY